MKRNFLVFLSVCCMYLGVSIFLLRCEKPEEQTETTYVHSSETLSQHGYIGSKNCIDCHKEQHDEWMNSHHDLAMKEANSQFIRGDFNDVQWEEDSMKYLFYKKDSTYFVQITEENSTNNYPIKYTFGWEPLQQYLIEFPNGKYQTLRASWDTEEKKWFHQYPDTIIPQGDWLHWTENAQNWNNMCASCHSTNLEKNFNEDQFAYNTTFSEINVACEACHGPGEKHANAMKNGEKYDEKLWNLSAQQTQVSVCGSCHARRTMLTNDNNPHPEYLSRFFPALITKDNYHPDGQIDNEDYVLSSFLSSKMSQNNVRCTSCHNPHTTKLKFNDNRLCTQCHEQSYALEEHHFHPMDSEGAQCINCHMDGKKYMGNDYRRDHSFRIPRPDQSITYGTPNACTSCHEDKSDKWAKEAIEKHFGKERKYHFSDDLLPGSKLDEKSAPHLVKLIADSTQTDLVRATALQYLSYIMTEAHLPIFIEAMTKPNTPLLRQAAYTHSLQVPQLRQTETAWQGLKDSIRAVRIASFRLIADLNIPTSYQEDYNKVQKEYEEMLFANADMVNGQVQKGDYHQRMGEPQKAIKAYQYSLKMDSLQIPVRLNLAIILSNQGRSYDALEVLKPAVEIQENNETAHYYLGLLYGELNDFPMSIKHLKKAAIIAPQNETYTYNLIVTLMKNNQRIDAKKILDSALRTLPNSQRIQSLIPYFQSTQ
ncbi:HEAT repeat domain-containing protein [Sediminitomix flava]|uniref:Putative CXXCH cytochrome family protein n=1 Tax=Sediminitomix flava TaxID=379075 RepID=A0A315ZBT1_SEDFL|nr:HEAT repeat domain-containing protein [Sediminitomix flava]PWJ42619.1 putative CXXCH cytochrome family protein [Sediminitomix flava]